MNLIDKIKKKLGLRVFKKANCGSINVSTGEITQGYQSDDGTLKYKSFGKVELWKSPEYVGIITKTTEFDNIVFGTTRNVISNYALYKLNNKYSGERKYFIDDGGNKKRFINPDAWEKNGVIIFI